MNLTPAEIDEYGVGLSGEVPGKPRFWLILLLAALHFAAIAAMLLSARWIVALGGSKSTLGWFSASILPGLALGAPLAGWLVRRVAERRLLLLGAALVACSLLALSQTGTLSLWLVCWRLLQGFGHGMVFACIFSLAAHAIPDGRKAQGIGYVALTIQVGNLAGVSYAEWLLQQGDFPIMYLGAAILSIVTVLAALALPLTPARPDCASGLAAGETPALVPGRRQVILSVAFFFVLGGTYGTVLQLIPLLVSDVARNGGSSNSVAPLMAAIFITVALCRLFLAKLADGRYRRPVLVGFTVILCLSTFAWPHASTMPQLLGVATLFALGYGLLFPGLNGLVLSHVAPQWRSRASGWVVMAFDGGFFGMLLLLGPLAEEFGYTSAFCLLAGLQMFSGLMFLRMTNRLSAS